MCTLSNHSLNYILDISGQAANIIQNFLKPSAKNKDGFGQLRDILLIMDASGSIGSVNFIKAKEQLGRLLGFLCPVPGEMFYV